MYRPPSKRKQLIRRTIVYAGMSFVVVALVALLLFIVQGYQFNRESGGLEPGGLIQFDTRPGGAEVTINGRQLGGRTATKTTMIAGQHFVTMTRPGYHSWQKSVTLQPGAVLWLDYARLIPTTLTQENIAGFTAITSMAASADAKWVALKDDPATPELSLVDISGDTVRQSQLALPVNTFTAPAAGKSQQFAIETWGDNRHLLVRHTVNDTIVEWLLVDVENLAQTVNISKLLGVSIEKVVFGNNSNTLFVQTGKDVRKVDVSSGTMSRPLVSNVAEFSLYEDRRSISFVTAPHPETNVREVGYYKDGADRPIILRSFTDSVSTPLHIAIGEYFSENYVGIAHGESVEILKARLQASEATEVTTIASYNQPGGATFMENRMKGRFFVTQAGSTFQTYDLELKQLYTTTLQGSQAATAQLQWLDGYTAWSDLDGKLRLYEFDGANQHEIASVVPGKNAFLGRDGTYLYMVTGADSKQHLSRVRLILP